MDTQAFIYALINPEQFLFVPLLTAFTTSHPALLEPYGALWIRDTLNISKSEAHSAALLTRISELIRIMKYTSYQLNVKKTTQIWPDKLFSPSFWNLPKQSSMVPLSTFSLYM